MAMHQLHGTGEEDLSSIPKSTFWAASLVHLTFPCSAILSGLLTHGIPCLVRSSSKGVYRAKQTDHHPKFRDQRGNRGSY